MNIIQGKDLTPQSDNKKHENTSNVILDINSEENISLKSPLISARLDEHQCIMSQSDILRNMISREENNKVDEINSHHVEDEINTDHKIEEIVKTLNILQFKIASYESHRNACHSEAPPNNIKTFPCDNDFIGGKAPLSGSVHAQNHEQQGDICMKRSNPVDYYALSLRRQSKALKSLLCPIDISDKSIVSETYKICLPDVKSEKRELQRSLNNYLESHQVDQDVFNYVQQVLEDSDVWCKQVSDIYMALDLDKKSQAKKLYGTLGKFSSNSEIDIFEFFEQFECVSADFEIIKEKAEFLFLKYLDADIQEEIIRYRGDYKAMKNFLLDKYGDFRRIVDKIITPLFNLGVPEFTADLNTKLSFFRKYQCALQKINKLLSSNYIDALQLETYIFGHDFMKMLLHLLPEWSMDTYIKSMEVLNQSISKIGGKIAFITLVDAVDWLYKKYDDLILTADSYLPLTVRLTNSRLIQDESSNRYSAPTSGYSSLSTESEDVLSDSSQSTYSLKRKVSLNKFPCTLRGHTHGLAECPEFFILSPKERVNQRKDCNFKHCTLCLQSSEHCKYKKCVNKKDIPKSLVCTDCKALSKSNHKACYSVLFCCSSDHKKPHKQELLSALKQYIPGF